MLDRSEAPQGWLVSLRTDNERGSWGDLNHFLSDVTNCPKREGRYVVATTWAGRHNVRLGVRPRPGDGIGFYFSSRSRTPSGPGIYAFGELRRCREDDATSQTLTVAIDEEALGRNVVNPLLRSRHSGLFERIGIRQGPVFAWYHVKPDLWCRLQRLALAKGTLDPCGLWSTRHTGAARVEKLSVEWLASHGDAVDLVWVLAAFWDEEFLSTFLRSLPKPIFRQGSLYFEPKIQIQFSFDGLHCPPEYNEALGQQLEARQIHPHLEPGRAIRSYSVKRALGIGDDSEGHERVPVHIRPHSIETCFGYWVPEAYRRDLEAAIGRAGECKRARLNQIRDRLHEKPRGELLLRYEEMLRSVESLVREFEARLPRGLKPWNRPDPADARRGYEVYLKRLDAKLSDEDFMDRASRKLTDTPMPEIWADPLAAAEFTDSFFEYAEWALAQSSSGALPLIVRQLRQEAGWGVNDDQQALLEKLKARISKGWDEERDW
ncbi:MAG: hypothetical protein HYZ28_20055 [Myxococcales bacterium]|nr:hypothetical protein [Myxococcales bacterium]